MEGELDTTPHHGDPAPGSGHIQRWSGYGLWKGRAFLRGRVGAELCATSRNWLALEGSARPGCQSLRGQPRLIKVTVTTGQLLALSWADIAMGFPVDSF